MHRSDRYDDKKVREETQKGSRPVQGLNPMPRTGSADGTPAGPPVGGYSLTRMNRMISEFSFKSDSYSCILEKSSVSIWVT